jgi:SAM-dependent methyltransferase
MDSNLAWTFPIISPPEEYEEEAEDFCRFIQKHARYPARTLLDLGCGSGHLDAGLKKNFQVTGIDLSPEMLNQARLLNPEVTYLPGDMRSLRLGLVFDAVVIGDSIDYMLSEAELGQALLTAWEHLRPGGVFCTFAEYTQEHFEQNLTHSSTYRQDNLEIAFLHNNYDPDPADTTYESTFIYLIRQNGQLHIETDRHLGGLFPIQTWFSLLREIGFTVKLDESTWENPFFIGLKP